MSARNYLSRYHRAADALVFTLLDCDFFLLVHGESKNRTTVKYFTESFWPTLKTALMSHITVSTKSLPHYHRNASTILKTQKKV